MSGAQDKSLSGWGALALMFVSLGAASHPAETPQLQQAQPLLEHSCPTLLHKQARGMLMVWKACPFPQKDKWSLLWTIS